MTRLVYGSWVEIDFNATGAVSASLLALLKVSPEPMRVTYRKNSFVL